MKKIGEEKLENGQVLEVFRLGKAIIKQPKANDQVEVKEKIKYTKKQFILMFEKSEWSKFKKLCTTDEAAEQYYDAVMAADYIDLEDQDIINGLGYMVQKEILTVERMSEILGE